MNALLIMCDRVRQDHISAYGVPAPWTRPGHEDTPFIHTPNLDRLAAGVVSGTIALAGIRAGGMRTIVYAAAALVQFGCSHDTVGETA